MFDKILIANRGEISCRVSATARRLGIATVAVFSEADAAARHVALADEAICIGPPEAQASYLRIDKIIDSARRSGAQAIHPGYGFLSENAEFAEACAASGLTFIGPPPGAIRKMGLKGAAKAIMESADVPVVPGYHGEDQSPAVLAQEAERIGYPVLIKAVAGGGGKGMRRVDAPGDFAAALASAQREAKAAFANDVVLLEKYLVKPRHIEVQVFADQAGNAVHLFERDCSLQRRHQKIIEEAPAPAMSAEMRDAMGQAAVAAAQAIGYVGAGTVEFIADVSDGLSDDRFYFMEMNTRLQVEHPVTEMITDQDLVEWQIRVAAGGALPCTQSDLSITGHALEARLYAENPDRDFLPATGRIAYFRLPAETADLRIDTGVRAGDHVTPYYDPMIAKLIVHGRDRADALRRLNRALDKCQIAGLTTNLDFLRRVARHPGFAAADLDTGFIDRHQADLIAPPSGFTTRHLAMGALGFVLGRRDEQRRAAADPYSPWNDQSAWRLNDQGQEHLSLEAHDVIYDLTLLYQRDGSIEMQVQMDGEAAETVTGRGELGADGYLTVDLDGAQSRGRIALLGNRLDLLVDGVTHKVTVHDPLVEIGDEGIAVPVIAAPLPGKIIAVTAAAGDQVTKGQSLMVLEAMKMEHTIAAPADAEIKEIAVAPDDQVEEGAVLIEFEADG